MMVDLVKVYSRTNLQELHEKFPNTSREHVDQCITSHTVDERVQEIFTKFTNYYSLSENEKEDILSKLYELTQDSTQVEYLNEESKKVLAHLYRLEIEKIQQYSRLVDPTDKHPESWKHLCDSDPIKYTGGYLGRAYINTEEKTLLIASTGTKIDFFRYPNISIWNGFGLFNVLKDLINDIAVYMKSIPVQFLWGVVPFFEHVVENITSQHPDINLKEYKIVFGGHSLGGILSDLGTAFALTKHKEKFKEIKSVTFDNPGSKPMVLDYLKKLMEERQEESLSEEQIKELAEHFIIFNHRENLFNAVNEQFGKVVQIESERSLSHDLPYGRFIPRFIKSTLFSLLMHIEHHQLENFKSIKAWKEVPNWQEGLGDKIIAEVRTEVTKITGSCWNWVQDTACSLESHACSLFHSTCNTLDAYLVKLVGILGDPLEDFTIGQ